MYLASKLTGQEIGKLIESSLKAHGYESFEKLQEAAISDPVAARVYQDLRIKAMSLHNQAKAAQEQVLEMGGSRA
jgi:hypothetical protein